MSSRPAIPRTVWALGLVSLFMDLSSEIVHALLPIFLTVTLGASVAMVGLIDGIAEASAQISKVFSGYLSDRMGRRKPLILVGYGLAALTKPLFPLAGTAGLVLGARFADRIGKGLRGAPRDALIADVTPPGIRGRAFGLRQSLDTVGGFLGPLLAVGLMLLLANDIRTVFWIAVIPAVVSVVCVIVGVRDAEARPEARVPIRTREALRLGRPFWMLVAIGVLFTLARFSEAFLILKASGEGLPAAFAPLVLVAMNLVFSLGAYPAGVLADTLPARTLLLSGLALLIAADLVLAFTGSIAGAFAGIALWGGHMALSQGLLAKLVADQAPAEARGTAFGLYNLSTGIALLAASVVAGLLWDAYGPTATFIAGAAFAFVAAVMLILWRGGR